VITSNPSKYNTTSLYFRLPTGPGVPSPSLTGFDFAVLGSRKPVEKELSAFLTFCRRDAKSLNVKILKAEWGEGKTDAYDRYIHPETEKHQDACYYVSTSTIVDKIRRFEDFFPTTAYVPSSKCLASIFAAIIDESIHQELDIKHFPNPLKYQKSPLQFIEHTLENHKKAKYKKIFVFIDEFEELLIHDPEIQKQIISGIKELINGQLKMIHEGGTYQGILHFFISCTPYAYIRIMDSPEMAQMTGSVKSRLTTLELPEVPRREALQFLIDLTRYSYDGQLPKTFPFWDTGPLNGIYAISHGNLREMIKLFVKCMSTAVDKKKLRVIDYSHFLESLRDEEIAIYGFVGKAIDSELLDKTMAALNNISRGDECQKLLQLLIGEFLPFFIGDAGRRLELPKGDIHELVTAINTELKKIGVEKGISALMPIKDDKTFDSVVNRLNLVQNQIVIGQTKIPLEKFKEKLISYRLKTDGTLSESFMFPREARDLEVLFEELTQEEAEKLYMVARECFDQTAANRHYVLSQNFADQIFPSPLWRHMDFVKDRSKRMDLWRAAAKEYTESVKEFRDGVIRLIEHSGLGRFESEEVKGSKYYSFYYNISPGRTAHISAYLYVSTGSITAQDLDNMTEDIRKRRPNLLILVYTGDMEATIPSVIDGIDTPFLQLHMRKLRAMQLIVAELAEQKKIEMDYRILDQRLREISDDIELKEKRSKWHNDCETTGIIIYDLRTRYAESGSKLAGILKYYINFLGRRESSSEIFEQYENTLRKIKFFGDREVPFAPVDIESVKEFTKYEKELAVNGFLTLSSDSTVEVVETPVERRLMSILKKYPKMPLSNIRQYFISVAQAENLLERVYIPILIHKGLIQQKGDELTLMDLRSLQDELEKRFVTYDVGLTTKSPSWHSFLQLCVTKGRQRERDMLILDLNYFDQLIRNTVKEIDQEADDRTKFQRIHLVMLLLDYYQNKLEPRVDSASNAAITLKNKCHTQANKIKTILESVLDLYNVYCSGKQYVADDIIEFLKLSEILETVDETFEAAFTVSELNDIFKEFKWDNFHFNRDPSMAHFFSLKCAKLEKLCTDLNNLVVAVKSSCDTTQSLIDSTEETKKEIQRDLSRYEIPAKYKVSSKIIDLLQQYQSKPAQAQSAIPKIKMSVVREFFTSLEKQLSKDKAIVQHILVKVENIKKEEKDFLDVDRDQLLSRAKKFFVEFYGDEILGIESDLNKATETYAGLLAVMKEQKGMSLDDLSHVTDTAEKRFGKVITPSIISFEQKLASLFENAETTLTKIKNEVHSFLEILQKGVGEKVEKLCHEYSGHFTVEIDITLGALKTAEEGGDTEYKWTERLATFDSLRAKLFEALKPILPPDQGEVLLEIVRILEAKGEQWVDMQMLISEIEKHTRRSKGEIAKIIEELAKMNLLREGASLPIL